MTSTRVSVELCDQHALPPMSGHHAELRSELDDRVRTLRTVVRTHAACQQQLAALREFVDGSVLPHATAEERKVYSAAAADAPPLVEAMRAEHRTLVDRARALTLARSSVQALAAAEGLAAVFTVHMDKENELLLPLLARVDEVRLAALLQAMHQRLDELQNANDTPDR